MSKELQDSLSDLGKSVLLSFAGFLYELADSIAEKFDDDDEEEDEWDEDEEEC